MYGSGLADAPVDDDHDPIAERERLDPIVGNQQRGDTTAAQHAAELATERFTRGSIERRERLVQQQKLRIGGKCTRQCDTLLLAAGKLRRITVLETVKIEQSQQAGDARLPCGSSAADREADVLHNRKVRKQRILLEQKPGPSLLRWQTSTRAVVEPDLVAHANASAVGPFETTEAP